MNKLFEKMEDVSSLHEFEIYYKHFYCVLDAPTIDYMEENLKPDQTSDIGVSINNVLVNYATLQRYPASYN